MVRNSCVLIFMLWGITSWSFVQMHDTKLVIDNDAGGDDAMAIFMALLYEKYYNGPEVIALTTGNGNTEEENVYKNNQRILKVAHRQDIPIYRGLRESVVQTPKSYNYFGVDGLGDSNDVFLDTDLVPAKEEHAVIKLIELSKIYKENLNILTIGTLTNVALAIKLDPSFLGRIGQLYVGAGHIHNEFTPNPEFNAHMDVEAYHMVAQSANPDQVTVLPYSQVKEYLNISREWRENELGAIETDIMRAQNKFERISLPKDDRWHALDPSLVGLVVKPELVHEYKYSKNDILMCGDKRGMNTNEFVEKKDANVRIIYSIKTEEFKTFLLDVFSADLSVQFNPKQD